MKKIIYTTTLALASLLLLSACSTNEKAKDSAKETATSQTSAKKEDLNKVKLPQLSKDVAEDESLVEMVTNLGNIKIKLFPKIAPKAVENFITHAKDGYYNGVTFHRVIQDFMIQGGDPEGTGAGGESIWKKPFEDEFSNQLYNIRGALSMANSGPNTNGSQFFIVQNSKDVSDGLLVDDYPQAIIDAYKNGGTPYLDNVHTVFGQVIDGMDIVDKIAAVKATNDKPDEAVKIEKITILQEAK